MHELLKAQELKRLQSRMTKLKGDLNNLEAEKTQITEQINYNHKAQQEIKNKIKALTPPKTAPPIVSEHALLRYIERVLKIDIKQIVENILTKSLIKNHSELGNGTYPNGDYKAVIKNGVVISIKK